MPDSIRIAHLADTHLGYRAYSKIDPATNRNQRTVDAERAFERSIDHILQQNIDVVLHAGDLFDYPRPNWITITHFIEQFQRLQKAGIRSLVIGGNHDTPRAITGGTLYSVAKLALPLSHFVTGHTDEHVTDLFDDLNLHVHAVPHGALAAGELPVPRPIAGKRNVLLLHGIAPGVNDLMPKHEQNEESQLSDGMFPPGFDYIALGDFHKNHQVTGIPNAWYAGSSERFGFGNYEVVPGYQIVTLGEPGGGFTREHIADPDVRPMKSFAAVSAEGANADWIVDHVTTALAKDDYTQTIVRFQFFELDPLESRIATKRLKRELGDTVWHIQIDAVGETSERPILRLEEEHMDADLVSLFENFIEVRTPLYHRPGFSVAFREQGLRLLRTSAEASQLRAPEDAHA